MNKLYLGLFLLMTIFLVSCSNDITSDTEFGNQENEYVTVSLALDGLSESRASQNDVYGINVLYDADKDGVCEKNYAYGLFDNKDDMTITLLNSYSYKFICTLVKNAKNVLSCGSGGLMDQPFHSSASSSVYINNEFTYSTTYLSGLDRGYSKMTSGSTSDYPATDRYYGETDQYKPTTGGRVTIEMKRTVFALQYFVSGIEDGSATISGNSIKDLYNNSTNGISLFDKTSTVDYQTEELLYTYMYIKECYENEQDLEYTFTLSYDSNRGDLWDYSSSKTVTLKRNTLVKIYVNVDVDKSSANFNIIEEEMDEDNIINIGLNTNGLIDVIVDPNEEQ